MIPADDRTPVAEWEPTTLEDVYALLTNLRPEWHQYAACRGTAAEHHEDGNIFFPERGGDGKAGREARKICKTCPVEPECLEFGLTQREGIWGGTNHSQRKTIRSQRNGPRRLLHVEPCGTEAGYARHYRRKESPCEPCRTAHRKAHRERKEKEQDRMTDTAKQQPPPRPEWLDRAEEAKLLAEAEEVTAKANLHRAEATKHQVEAEKLAAEARISHAVAAESEHRAAKAAIDREREEHKRRKELVADEFHHVYTFDGVVSDASVSACQKQMSTWERLADAPIDVVLRINSPGGGIFEGFALVDYLEGMIDRGNTVDTHAYGMAASMGGVLLQVGKTRRMGKSAHLLIHEAQFRTGGKTGDVEDEMKLVHMLQDRILDMYADRAKGSSAAKPMNRNQIKRNWYRRDWWIPAADCLKHGFIDEIA